MNAQRTRRLDDHRGSWIYYQLYAYTTDREIDSYESLFGFLDWLLQQKRDRARQLLENCPTCRGDGLSPSQETIRQIMLSLAAMHGAESNEIARRMRISKSYVSRLENGSSQWSRELVDRYTRAVREIADERIERAGRVAAAELYDGRNG